MYLIYIIQLFGEDRYLQAAKSCADVIWSRGLLKKGYGICHGVSGNAYAFLAMYKLTDNEEYLHKAIKVRTCSPHCSFFRYSL